MSKSTYSVSSRSDPTTEAPTPGTAETPAPLPRTDTAPSASGYESARDVDGDGTVDVIHGVTPDGFNKIAHVDDAGNVTLLEVDTDGSGTYETAISAGPDGTIRVAVDFDDDGQADAVGYLDGNGNTVRKDVIEGGLVIESKLDTNGDGRPDVVVLDSDRDGRGDTVIRDTDGDHITDDIYIDTDGNGAFDLHLSVIDGDGDSDSSTTGPGAATDPVDV